MKHRGEIIEEAVRKSGIPLTLIAKRMKKSRRHLYNIFQNPHLSLDEIVQIGKIIHHDFSENFTELRNLKKIDSNNNLKVLSDSFWKDKYLELLEKYNYLLEKITRNS